MEDCFAIRTVVLMLRYYVIFTTLAKNVPQLSATPTVVRRNEVEWASECCIFYINWHITLDFTIKLVYNKA